MSGADSDVMVGMMDESGEGVGGAAVGEAGTGTAALAVASGAAASVAAAGSSRRRRAGRGGAAFPGADERLGHGRHVALHRLPQGCLAQRGRGVVHGVAGGRPGAGRRVDGPRGAVHTADGVTGHERLQAESAERHHEGGVEDLQLAAQEGRAGGHLVRLRVAVAGRPALHDVGDEDVLAAPADQRQELLQEAAGGAHEGTAEAVLVLAGPLPHEHDLRVRVTLTRHGLGALLREAAAPAGADLAGDGVECCLAFLARHASPTARRDAAASQSLRARISAISTAFVAAPLRRLSATTQKARPRPSGTEGSWRMRPT